MKLLTKVDSLQSINLCDIPIDGKINHIENTRQAEIPLMDGYYYDSNTGEYFHYVTNPHWIKQHLKGEKPNETSN
jgi:hypothetical protein